MNANKYDHLIKILLIGDSGVGKTSLLLRFDENKFSHSFISTLGIDFRAKMTSINNETVKLQIWDTSGQERFRTITRAFYRGAMGIMIIFDLTESESFENIKKWMATLDDNVADGTLRVLVGAKCDLDKRRVITEQMGRELAEEYKIDYVETSSVTGHNVDDLFMGLSTAIYHEICAKKNKQEDLDETVIHINKGGDNTGTVEESKCCS